jgi:hypothetical protein
MSESTPETTAQNNKPEPGEVSDEMLPDDLQPTDDNPLAKPPSDDDEDTGMSLGPDGPQG